MRTSFFPIMTSFDFKTWCSDHGLKQKTIDKLWKRDLHSQETLTLVHTDDIATLDLTLGQKKLLLHTLAELNSAEKIPKAGETKPIETTPVTTKKLASDGGFGELLKKNGRVSLNNPPVTLGATKQPLSVPLERVDNNPQVFVGVQDKKAGETKPFLILDFVSIGDYNGSVEDEQEIGGATDACIILRLPRSKLKLENISLSMWVAANARIMHNLTNTGT